MLMWFLSRVQSSAADSGNHHNRRYRSRFVYPKKIRCQYEETFRKTYRTNIRLEEKDRVALRITQV